MSKKKKKKKKHGSGKKSAPKSSASVVKKVNNQPSVPVNKNNSGKAAPAPAPKKPEPKKPEPKKAVAPVSKEKNLKSRKFPVWAIVLIAVLLCAAVIVGLIFLLKSCKPGEGPGTTTTKKPDDPVVTTTDKGDDPVTPGTDVTTTGSDDPEIPPHEHSFAEEWTTDAENHWHVCSGCDVKGSLEAHTFGGWVVTVEPTEETEGSRSRACSVCKYTETEVVPALEHTHKFGAEWLTDETNHWHVCSGCGEIDSLGEHTYGDWIVTIEATEETEGSRYRVCTVCGYTATETVDKLPHTHKFSSKWTYDDDYHWHICSGCDAIKGKAAHEQDKWSVIKEATETDPVGIIGRVCKCGYIIESKTYDYVPPVSGVVFYWDDGFSGTECYIKGIDGYAGDELVIPSVVRAVNSEGKVQLKVLTDIGDGAFFGTKLKKITLPETITTIGDSAFASSKSLTSITIPGSVVTIGDEAFSGSYITEVIIEDGVVTVGNKAFYNCGSLTSVVIPASVTSIGDKAFADCASLVSITVDEDNETFSGAGNCIVEKATGRLVLGCKSSVIPEGVTSIGDYAFYNCRGIESVVIPEGVTRIGRSAFEGCLSLTSISFPSTITAINGFDFIKTPLNSITMAENDLFLCSNNNIVEKETGVLVLGRSNKIPEGTKVIGEYAFAYCDTVINLTIPEGVTEIAPYAFIGCQILSKVTLPESLASIGAHAFENCKYLSSINVAESVTVGEDAFKGCIKLAA